MKNPANAGHFDLAFYLLEEVIKRKNNLGEMPNNSIKDW